MVIRHESWVTTRIVSLGEVVHPVEDHSVLGHANGKYDGDTLVIETASLGAGWDGLGRNALGSDRRSVSETYRLIDRSAVRLGL